MRREIVAGFHVGLGKTNNFRPVDDDVNTIARHEENLRLTSPVFQSYGKHDQ